MSKWALVMSLYQINLLNCYVYILIPLNNLRQRYIKRYFTNRPSMYKLIELLNTHNKSELCMLSKYVTEAVKLRNLIIY